MYEDFSVSCNDQGARAEQYYRHLRLDNGTGRQRFPTRRRLDGGWHRGADNVAGASGRSNTPLLVRGASGSVVTALQKGLKKYSTPATDPGAVDGDFGPKTEAAVKAYQQDRGVQADGIVGDLTWWAPAGAAGATLASLSGLTTV
jgi:peptidoglycan hydrolase-like protein with peptidoglycan-binding domain